MARISKPGLLDRVLRAIEESGRAVLVENASHPFVLRVEHEGEFLRTRVYIWNVTHGGKSRAADEYRIQITGVEKFSLAGVDRALVLGWWEEGGVFAAWDISKHTDKLGSSPSFQVVEGCLIAAATESVATQRKENDEIAVAFVPTFLADYIVDQSAIHGLASSAKDLAAFTKIISDPGKPEAAVAAATAPRRVVLTQVARKLREAGFSRRVLRAYANACAMCGVQLRLIDAAHIIPVAKVNNDATCNGVALCALHHRAYDRALVSMDEKYRIVLNPDRLASLTAEHRVGGFPTFKKNLRAILALPPALNDRPDPDHIREGNRARGWKKFTRVA